MPTEIEGRGRTLASKQESSSVDSPEKLPPEAIESPEAIEPSPAAKEPDIAEIYAKARQVFTRLGPARILAVMVVTCPFIGMIVIAWTMSDLAPWLQARGTTGMVVYVAGFSLLGGLALLPTWILAVLAGFAFKTVAGSLAALAGILGASLIGYTIARLASGRRAVQLIEEQPKWKAVYDALIGGTAIRTLLIVTLIRVPNNSPFAVTNLVLAATRVPAWIYAIGTAVGIAPRTIAAVVVGSSMTYWDPDNTTNKYLIIAGIVAMVIVIAVIGTIANRAISRVTKVSAGASNA